MGAHEPSVREVLDNIAAFVGVCSPDGVLLHANHAAFEGTGFEPGDVLGRHFSEIPGIWPSTRISARVRQMVERAAAGQVARDELPLSLAGGRTGIFDISIRPILNGSGRVVEIIASGFEVTARKRAENDLMAVSRSLRVLIACNEALVRATNEDELLQRICQLIVEVGGYRFAWVGYAEQGLDRQVRPVARAGYDAGYLADLRIQWDDSAWGNGPIGRSIRSRKPEIAQRIDAAPEFAPWRKAALERGYAAAIAVPLLVNSECIGALAVYSSQPNDFDPTEAGFLNELGSNLAFGIEALRIRVGHERAQSQVRTFRRLLDRTNDLIYVIDATSGAIVDANNTVSRQLGYSHEELLKMHLGDFSITVGERPWPESLSVLRSTGSAVMEGRHRCKDGKILAVEVSLSYVEQDHRPYLINVARDISERKRQEDQIARLGRVLRMQSAVNAAVLRIADRDELLQEACRIATQVGGYDRAVVSIVEADGRSARPRYRAGAGADYPEPEILHIGDGTEPDTSLTGFALRSGEVAVCSDANRTETPLAMRQQLIDLGFRSFVALPILVEGARVAALTLASRDGTLVGETELSLLQDVTTSLSFALRSQRHAEAARFLEAYDPSTGLAKRALFCQRFDRLLRERFGAEERPIVAVFDIQQLSNINDTFGRPFGDLVLQHVAERLKYEAQSDERIASLGGGSFALLEPQLAPAEESINSLLERAVFSEPFSIQGRSIRLSCRSGSARYPADGGDGGTLLAKAEAALKRAKETGERYLHYKIEMQSELALRLSLEHRLRTAIDEQQFEVYYQPQISLKTEHVESLEALLRWNDPEQGIIQPAAFLPLLESSGMIVAVGDWVLNRVLEDCARWHRLQFVPIRIAVNVSALQFRRRTFVPRLLAKLSDWALGRSGFGVDLEITETSLLQDLEGTSRKLRELRAAGVRIALDDFGTGYSSLGLLSKLPVDLLKIDRSFVMGLPDDPASVNLTASIIGLALTFGLTTVAEGVETRRQFELLRALRCDQCQGYLYGRPATAREIEATLAQRK